MAGTPPDMEKIVQDASFLAHRYIEKDDQFRFLPVDRELHRSSSFLTDEVLPDNLAVYDYPRQEVVAVTPAAEKMHFIFHSAYCCSTMLARAFDIEGYSMGLKEPVILNDMVGWKRRGAKPRDVAEVLDQSMDLLGRPFGRHEAVIVKPSNIVNSLAVAMLAIKPNSQAVLLHAPLKTYLRSIAKKDMWGRLWVRELLVGQIKDGLIAPFGYSGDELLGLSDLQVAAVGWLAQQALFNSIVERYGDARVRTLNSEDFLKAQRETMLRLSNLFGLPLDETTLQTVLDGEAFTRHSKLDKKFGADSRTQEHADAAAVHADEIMKVHEWASLLAERMAIPMLLPAPLL